MSDLRTIDSQPLTTPTDRNSMCSLIRKARAYRSYTLREMARYVGVSSARISAIERGVEEPTDEELEYIAACIAGVPRYYVKVIREHNEKTAAAWDKTFRDMTTPTTTREQQ